MGELVYINCVGTSITTKELAIFYSESWIFTSQCRHCHGNQFIHLDIQYPHEYMSLSNNYHRLWWALRPACSKLRIPILESGGEYSIGRWANSQVLDSAYNTTLFFDLFPLHWPIANTSATGTNCHNAGYVSNSQFMYTRTYTTQPGEVETRKHDDICNRRHHSCR